MRIAYLVGRPGLSQTFIAREVEGLRALGVEVHELSIRRAPAADLLSDEDRAADARTWSVLPLRPAALLVAHLGALLRRPRRYLQTLRLAMTLSARGVRSDLWHLFYFAEAIVVWRLLRQRGIAHVHVHFANVAAAVALLAAHYGERDSCSWSFTMHGPTEFDDVVGYALAEKVRRASFVVCIGDYCRSQLMKLVDPAAWGKLEIVHCGLDPSSYPLIERPDRNGHPTEVLCVGRLVPDKGQSILLDAVAELDRRGAQVALTLVGEGPDRATLDARAQALGIEDRVRLVGAVSQDRMVERYAAADIFCLPSFAEGVPVVLMEAMATGLPVVTTRITGVPELVQDEVSGALVAPGRSDALADALQRLTDDPSLRARWGAAGRERVASAYDIAASVRRLHALFADHAVRPPERSRNALAMTRARKGSPSTR